MTQDEILYKSLVTTAMKAKPQPSADEQIRANGYTGEFHCCKVEVKIVCVSQTVWKEIQRTFKLLITGGRT